LVDHPASVTDTPDWVLPYTRYITTTVPADVRPNEKFSAITPQREVHDFVCPVGCAPGTTITVAVVDAVVPVAAVATKDLKFSALDGQELPFPKADAEGQPLVEGTRLPLRYTPLSPESVSILPPERRGELKRALEEVHYFNEDQQQWHECTITGLDKSGDAIVDAAGQEHTVPQDKFATHLKGPWQNMRLKDAIFVCKLTAADVHQMLRFLRNDYEYAPAKSFWPERNIRVGYDDSGVYINHQHWRRHVGVLSGGGAVQTTPSLATLIKEELQDNLLELIFNVGDKNKDGKMDRGEFQLLLRRVAPTVSTGDVDKIYKNMDKDDSKSLTCGEFILFLKQKSAADIRNKLSHTLGKDVDYVKACFRLIDKNGDGSISEQELKKVCTKVCPSMTQADINAFFKALDADGRHGIDYSEFVDFLWRA